MLLLRGHSWDGNIRELRNILTRAMYSCFGTILSSKVIESVLQGGHHPPGTPYSHASVLLDLRRHAVLDAYRRNGGNISRTAHELSVSRNTVYRELRRAGVLTKEDAGPEALDASGSPVSESGP